MATNPNYVRSTDGVNTDDGSTWELANLDLSGIAADTLAGYRTWISDNHAESTAGAVTMTSPGTLASPCQILCGDDAAEPPTALATTATVTTTGANAISLNGSYYMYGVTFNCGTGAVNADITFFQDTTIDQQYYDNCAFNLVATGSACSINVGLNANSDEGEVWWKNTSCSFGATGQAIEVTQAGFVWEGGSVTGATAPTTLIRLGATATGKPTDCRIEGVDLSVLGSGKNLVDVTYFVAGKVIFANCKLGASVALKTGTWSSPGAEVLLHNCDSADTNYRFAKSCYAGDVVTETTIVKTSGSSDGTTPFSFKMDSSANAEYPLLPLIIDLPAVWNDTTGTSKTATVEFVHDTNVAAGQGAGTSFAFRDDEIWLEVQYLGTSGFPKSLFVNDAPATVIAAAADQTSSAVDWTTTGMTTPVKQKLSVTFTPQEKGFIQARVFLAKASKTVYVDGDVTIA